MYGTECEWTSINLRARTGPAVDGFPTGSARTFCLKGPDIGQLHHLSVNVSILTWSSAIDMRVASAGWCSFVQGMVSQRNRNHQLEHFDNLAMRVQLLAAEERRQGSSLGPTDR